MQTSEKSQNIIGKFGSRFVGAVQFAGGVFSLGMDCVREMFKPPFYFSLTVEQLYLIGVRSLGLVAVAGLATGSVMALQFGYGLEKFGGKLYVPKVLSLSVVREMGPVFTSLLVAARIGAGITAELGSMNVTQQIDAIRALGTSPIKRLVIPRLLATVIALPILTVIADFIGILGGMAVTVKELGQTTEFFISKTIESMWMSDFTYSLLKPIIFAIFIALAACYRGMTTSGGTRGVGEATTWAVVTTNVFVMISDFFITKLIIIISPFNKQ